MIRMAKPTMSSICMASMYKTIVDIPSLELEDMYTWRFWYQV